MKLCPKHAGHYDFVARVLTNGQPVRGIDCYRVNSHSRLGSTVRNLIYQSGGVYFRCLIGIGRLKRY